MPMSVHRYVLDKYIPNNYNHHLSSAISRWNKCPIRIIKICQKCQHKEETQTVGICTTTNHYFGAPWGQGASARQYYSKFFGKFGKFVAAYLPIFVLTFIFVWTFSHNPTPFCSYVVYFDQLSGAACTWKLFELLFSVVFNLLCSF